MAFSPDGRLRDRGRRRHGPALGRRHGRARRRPAAAPSGRLRRGLQPRRPRPGLGLPATTRSPTLGRRTGRRRRPPFGHQATVRGVAFSPDGRTVLTGSDDHTARLWDAATGAPIGRPMRHEQVRRRRGVQPRRPHRPDRRAGTRRRGSGTPRPASPIGRPLAHEDWVSSVAFSPDGRTVLTGSYDRTARLWDAATGRPDRPRRCGTSTASRPWPSAPTAGRSSPAAYDGTARLWDVADRPARRAAPPPPAHGLGGGLQPRRPDRR